MDAFFAAVEERERPYLKGQPIAIGSDPMGGKGRGVLSTANYTARAYGLKSAMPVQTAWRLSEEARRQGKPPVVFVSGKFRKYGEVSRRVMGVVKAVLASTPSLVSPSQEGEKIFLEQVSVDECYFDLSFAESFGEAEEIARRIKKDILKKERLTATIGIGPNKLIAKIASDFQKPDGLTVVEPEQMLDFLALLPIRKIPGVGSKAEQKLDVLGVVTVGDARRLTKEELQKLFGKWGGELYQKLRGENDSPVVVERPPAKSIGEQVTLAEDTLDMKILLPLLEAQCKNVAGYLTKEGFRTFRTVVLVVRFADFETVSRSRTLREPTGGMETLRRNLTQMFFPFLDRRENPRRKKIRLVGVRVEKLS